MFNPRNGATFLVAAAALVAFAANSVLCRLALGAGLIDPAGFSAIRLVSGGITLLVLTMIRGKGKAEHRGSWGSATALTCYAVAFSFAYVSLSAGTGALILFGAVQVTMILAGLRSGERPRLPEWLGLLLALAGLVVLVLPGLSAPSPRGLALMIVAGVAWGVYSVSGRGAGDPMVLTTDNFLKSMPIVLAAALPFVSTLHFTVAGIALAVSSGALASALGYVAWYAALRGMSATLAATIQLVVPVLAAFGGVLFLSEGISARLVGAACSILGGVALAVLGRKRGTT